MLIIKAPKLHIGQGLGEMTADVFGERIRGNYQMLGAHYTPKDLLFLMTAPPELPEELGGMTTLVTQNSNVDIRSVTLDVLNNVVNRIMLDGTQQFTYQDQVYITNVLNRLGVTNVTEFMNQVRQLRMENENTLQFTKLYRSELETILRQQMEGEKTTVLPIPAEKQEQSPQRAQDPKVTMCLEVFRRLDTARIFEKVHSFQRDWTANESYFSSNELRLAEQLRLSNAVALTQLKQEIYQQPQLQLLHHINQYELGSLMQAPGSEEEVISQAAVAALVSVVDQTVVSVLNRPQILREQWLSLENAMWQTAENTLVRFESYHSNNMLPQAVYPPGVHNAMRSYYQELKEYQQLRQSIYPSEHHQNIRSEVTWTSRPQKLQHPEWEAEEREEGEDRLTTLHSTALIRQVLESTPEWKLLPTRHTLRESVRLLQRSHEVLRTQQLRRSDTMVDRLREHTEPVLPRLTRVERVTSQLPGPEQKPPVPLTLLEAEQNTQVLMEQLAQIDQHNRTIEQLVQNETIIRKTEIPTGPDMPRTMRDSLRALEAPEMVLREIMTQAAEEQANKSPFTPREQALLKRADPATRELYERILTYQRDPEGALARGLVRPASLGALNAELQQAGQQNQPVEMEHRAQEQQEQQELARQGEAATRNLFRQILNQKNTFITQTQQGDSRIRTDGGASGGDGGYGRQPAQLEHISRETEEQIQEKTVREQSEVVLEKFLQLPNQRRQVIPAQVTQPGAIRFVHKQAPPDVTEELLEQLQQQSTRTTLHSQTDQHITQSHTQQTELTRTERQVVHQTTQDITELVNRTLARQMRTISDQVYRQMEKRLQTERSRRGR